MSNDVIAFIFCRGGSKGLPGKNIRPLGGKPLLAHSIDVAKQCAAIKRVIVSTDDQNIAQIATQYGAEVPMLRPPELANDNSNEWLAWQHAVNELAGQEFSTFISLPATSPLRHVKDVENCLNALTEKIDMVVTVTPARNNPWYSMIKLDEEGLAQKVIEQGFTRRQDAPAVYDCTGVAYVTRPEYIRSASGVYGGRVKPVVIPAERAVDIDDEFDFFIAESLWQKQAKLAEAS